jgi:tRNA pseudouridine(55) synthase
MSTRLPKYLTTQKVVGETPLQALERLRTEKSIPASTPLAYAGRLDPMASGTLLILIGDECKVQERYHSLDKEYQFEVLLGLGSDTHDVLGIIDSGQRVRPNKESATVVLRELVGTITLPYPHFSSKTVQGKPLHTWALEEKLDTITIPTKTSRIYSLELTGVRKIDTHTLQREVQKKIETIPTVTETSKALGRDFRRTDVRASWTQSLERSPNQTYTILTIRCIASSGTYMRTLASVIAERLGTKGLAYAIHRTRIGKYIKVPYWGGFFSKTYR